jgi:hypothetical protein
MFLNRLNDVKPLRGFGPGDGCIFLLLCFPYGKSEDDNILLKDIEKFVAEYE